MNRVDGPRPQNPRGYDLWGDTVKESHGIVGGIQVTESTHQRLRERYRFDDRGEIEVKGKGRLRTYLLVGRQADPAGTP